MKYLQLLAAALAVAPTVTLAAPRPPSGDVNPYVGKSPFAIPTYAKKLDETIRYFNRRGDFLNAARTRTVKDIPTFAWISKSADISTVKPLIRDALATQRRTRKKQLVQLVVYNLPDRDCSAKASDGEFKLDDDGFNKYKKFVDDVAAELSTREARELEFVVVLEPDSLGNLVTNMGIPKCAGAAQAYRDGTSYAIAKLQRENIAIYLDAAHGGWLGWDDNLAPSAKIFAEVLEGAQEINPKSKVRGLAINVSNYNQYISNPRENYTEWSNSWDEYHYVNSLAPHLEEAGYPANFIVDQGRAGKGGIRTEWGQWCNIRGAGFGIRPTADQRILNNTNVDAIVWVKPGGESDGTSDETAERFDEMCASPVAHVPAPEAGEWFNDFVVNLVKNADPPLKPTWW
ncbi:cellobiohydrolase [Coprinopsis cinerea okayama7|uniref:Glucanase n=2 Tax=Coprinopsis cinerea TaxID=5346 RepID=A8P8P9_COPC7|nr:cellobiohydrolase [Coprinopsis cinerea okayama7\|eukprot:XP_001839612.1 cellobiohydrolase [Coprinopsis cinerea okayama7\